MNDADQKFVDLIEKRQKLKAEVFPYVYNIGQITPDQKKTYERIELEIANVERELKAMRKERT